MTGTYRVLAALVVLALVVWFVASSRHSTRWRLVVAASYAVVIGAPGLFPDLRLAAMLAEIGLGIALIFVRRWENPKAAI